MKPTQQRQLGTTNDPRWQLTRSIDPETMAHFLNVTPQRDSATLLIEGPRGFALSATAQADAEGGRRSPATDSADRLQTAACSVVHAGRCGQRGAILRPLW